jgi:hypothetical protein
VFHSSQQKERPEQIDELSGGDQVASETDGAARLAASPTAKCPMNTGAA